MFARIGGFLRDERGIAALEYALIAGLIFAAVLAAGQLYGPQMGTAFSNLGTSLDKYDAGT